MCSVSSHISYLLLTCRRVEVPGLGTFQAMRQKAMFDDYDQTFYPSRVRISFTQTFGKNPEMLSHSLQRKMNIEAKEAGEMISDYVENIKRKMEKVRYCRIEGIGYLFKSKGALALRDTFWRVG